MRERTVEKWLYLFTVCCILGTTLTIAWQLAARPHALHLIITQSFTDDAYYYFVVADHALQSGRSTFDGISLTNGYHPLWFAICALIRAASDNLLAIKIVEVAILCASFPLLLSALRVHDLPRALICVSIFLWVTRTFSNSGMETSLLVFAFTLLVYSITRCWPGFMVGIVAAFCIGARLEAGLFVVPLVLLTRRKTEWLAPIAIICTAGVLYVSINYWIFGMLLPVSGKVKSLGGLQVNHLFIEQMVQQISSPRMLLRAEFGSIFIMLALAPFLALRSPARSLEKALFLSFLLGGIIYVGRIVLFSSWQVWPWYGFPTYIFLIPALIACDRELERFNQRQTVAIALRAGGGLCLIALSVFFVRPFWVTKGGGFMEVNRQAAQLLGEKLQSATVAMGDRAGSFGFYYSGGVVQIEGIVNDRDYFERLRTVSNILPFLCSRGVEYIVDWEPFLGRYVQHEIPTIRPFLSSFRGPSLTVFAEDEVARMSNTYHYGPSPTEEGDYYIYVWRVRC